MAQAHLCILLTRLFALYVVAFFLVPAAAALFIPASDIIRSIYSFIVFAIYVAFAVFLWFRPLAVMPKKVADGEASVSVDLEAVAYRIIGVYFFFRGLAHVYAGRIGQPFEWSNIYVPAALQIIFGIALVIGAEALRSTIAKRRNICTDN